MFRGFSEGKEQDYCFSLMAEGKNVMSTGGQPVVGVGRARALATEMLAAEAQTVLPHDGGA